MDRARCVRGDCGGGGKWILFPAVLGGEESRVKSMLGDAVAAWEREERERNLDFQMENLGVSIDHFKFATRMVMVRVRVAA